MAHICTVRQSCHAEVNFVLVSMGDDVMHMHAVALCIISTYRAQGRTFRVVDVSFYAGLCLAAGPTLM